MKNQKVIITSFLFLSLYLAAYHNPKKILIIHSYRPYYSWTQNINKGIIDILTEYSNDIDIKVEYMDMLKSDDEEHLGYLFKLYQHKYDPDQFNCIICSDNFALNFLLNNRSFLFSDTPIVFCGYNHFNDSILKNHSNITGIIEDVDVQDTLNCIFSLHKKIRKIILWSIVHKNSEINRNLAVSVIQDYDPSIEIIHFRDIIPLEVISELEKLNSNDIIILLSVLRDEYKKIIPVEKTAQIISKNTKAPVYSFFDFFLGYGIIGGKLVSGYEQGKNAALMTIKILKGVPVNQIPVIKESPNRYMFDWIELKKRNIKEKWLPENSIIINQSENFFTKYKYLVSFIIGLVFFLTIIIIILTAHLGHKIRMERQLKEERESLYTLSLDMLSIAGFDGYFKQLNPAWETTLGWSLMELKSRPWLDFVHPNDKEKTVKAGQKLKNNKKLTNFENRYRCKNGTYKWMSWNSFPLKSKDLIFGVARDFTEKKNLEEKLKKFAVTDSLTEINNRRSFFNLAKKEYARFKRYPARLSLLLLDIDNFKNINDTYGHQAGDLVLKGLVKKVKRILRENDIPGRIGGEEFAILLIESGEIESINVAERILYDIKNSKIKWQNQVIKFTVSIGLTLVKESDKNLDEIIHRADKALYRAKRKGKNRIEIEK